MGSWLASVAKVARCNFYNKLCYCGLLLVLFGILVYNGTGQVLWDLRRRVYGA
jgi:hypothetical protein